MTHLVGEEASVAEVLQCDRDAESEDEEETAEEEDVSDVVRRVAAAADDDAAHVFTVLQTTHTQPSSSQ